MSIKENLYNNVERLKNEIAAPGSIKLKGFVMGSCPVIGVTAPPDSRARIPRVMGWHLRTGLFGHMHKAKHASPVKLCLNLY